MARGRRRYSREQVLQAIADSGGIVSVVARRLGCDWNTARKYIDRWAETREAWAAEREKLLDLAESQLVHAIRQGDTATAKWVLARIGRHRGWGDRVELAGEVPLRVVVRWEDGPTVAPRGDSAAQDAPGAETGS